MTNQEILAKAIDQAVKNGWDFHWGKSMTAEMKKDTLEAAWPELIYSHDFAKAFWGEQEQKNDDSDEWYEPWKHHLQQQVISDDPIAYLERGLKPNPELLNGGRTDEVV